MAAHANIKSVCPHCFGTKPKAVKSREGSWDPTCPVKSTLLIFTEKLQENIFCIKYPKGSCWRCYCHVRVLRETARARVFKIMGNNVWCKGKWQPTTQPVEKKVVELNNIFFPVTERHYYHIKFFFLNGCCSFLKKNPTSFMPFSLEQNEIIVPRETEQTKGGVMLCVEQTYLARNQLTRK